MQLVQKLKGHTEARAHIESDGKLCLYASSGLFIDTSRPRQIIIDVLRRAGEVLASSLQAPPEQLVEELEAYWQHQQTRRYYSLVPADHPTGEISYFAFKRRVYLAPSLETIQKWAKALGVILDPKRTYPAFWLKTQKLINPPPFHKKLKLSRFLEKVEKATSQEESLALRDWLRNNELPLFVGVSLDIDDEKVRRAMLGVEVPPLPTSAQKSASRGFRPGRVPQSRIYKEALRQPVARITLDRLDEQYLVERGAGEVSLRSKSAVIVGCGALGSSIACMLASAGIGQLLLIDKEDFSPDNIHRHELGAESIGEKKVEALKKHFELRHPYLETKAFHNDVESVLEEELESVRSAGIVVLATGDETLELKLNDYFRTSGPRIHAWVEPLGAGGHALLTGQPERGCYRCLFYRDETGTMYNGASIIKPGQLVQTTIPGCCGFFTPFNSSAAKRTAMEAAELATRALLNEITRPQLITWKNSRGTTLELSLRGQSLRPGGTEICNDFGQASCPACGRP